MRRADHPATLRWIAAALGVPVAAFFEPPGGHSNPGGGAAELLALWDRIATETDRARLLAFARALAAGDAFAEPS